MRTLGIIATILGIVTDALTLIAYGRQGYIALPGNYTFELTPMRIWLFAFVGIFVTAYLYRRATGYWPLPSTGNIPIEGWFIIGAWALLAGFATGMW